MDADTYEEEMEDMRLDNERERHWGMVFEGEKGGVDDYKSIIHAKSFYVYMKKKSC